ncbi:winged helix-turn-helix domain-containing protein [Mycolicibacter arupensis]|jgi:predicted nucleotidyltransferase|uniref:ArsR family transcriptional regulator n=1 Tax=Mycolicibacter arupensis TaxID=342002 RepID=A0A5C7XU63_9MYCO|nr:winged helix-turn-helix domain-containing protein [Mycolicibacter arupensis]TXI52898.1 MAG: ArsR family transcriptional regulator [Mycolicibacter arupensis]
MRTDAPSLLPVFRSQHQAQLLAELLATPDSEYTVTELSQLAGVSLATTVRETQRLVECGILLDRKTGRTRLVSANADNPLIPPLTSIILSTFGPHVVVRREFSRVEGVEKIIIFGSWAARFAGAVGPPPNDIDVLVVGDKVSQLAVLEAASRSERAIGVQVTPQMSTPAAWEDPIGAKDPLLIEIKHRPLVEVLTGGKAVG